MDLRRILLLIKKELVGTLYKLLILNSQLEISRPVMAQGHESATQHVVGSIAMRGNEIFNIFISLYW